MNWTLFVFSLAYVIFCQWALSESIGAWVRDKHGRPKPGDGLMMVTIGLYVVGLVLGMSGITTSFFGLPS